MTNTAPHNFTSDDAIISYQLASEMGTIEKLCPKYGFIKCLSKENQDKRLFFHYTATRQAFENLQVGDNVTFQRGMSKGKPLALDIEFQSHVELMDGVIVKMPRKSENGSLSYKYNEECFYLPFGREDLADDAKLKSKDEVVFLKRECDGSVWATEIRKKYSKSVRVQGIVSAVKDKFGFIDRSDTVKEIYFNLSAAPEGVVVVPGLELEFNVKHLRNGKEEAVNLRVLEPHTVNFMDVFPNTVYGTLLRSPDYKRVSPGNSGGGGGGHVNGLDGSNGTGGDPLAGNISYVCDDGTGTGKVMQIPFGDTDKKHPYSLHPGDIVAFRIALDRRDQLQRATQVELCLAQFPSRKETRHLGVVKLLDASGLAGFIEPDLPLSAMAIGSSGSETPSPLLVPFKVREWLCPDTEPLAKFATVSYTPVQLSRPVSGLHGVTGNTSALRVLPARDSDRMSHLRLYAAGSLRGIVRTPALADELGIIICRELPSLAPNASSHASNKRIVAFTSDDVVKGKPRAGDEVKFGCLIRVACEYLPAEAFNIELVSPKALASPLPPSQQAVTPTTANSAPVVGAPPSSSKLRPKNVPAVASPGDALPAAPLNHVSAGLRSSRCMRGWVVIFKEFFGFVETADHAALYKFGPGTVKKSKLPSHEFRVGAAVEFIAQPFSGAARPRRIVDAFLRVVTEPLSTEVVLERRRVGTILRPLLISENTDRENLYTGLLEDVQSPERRQYPYSMKSLVSFRTKLSPSDRVLFDVVEQLGDGSMLAPPVAAAVTGTSLTTGGSNSSGADNDAFRRLLATNVVLLRQVGRVSSVSKGSVIVDRVRSEDDVNLTMTTATAAAVTAPASADTTGGDNGPLPVQVHIDASRQDLGLELRSLCVDELVQIDFDVDRGQDSRPVRVVGLKLLNRSADNNGVRKQFKQAADESGGQRILHWRDPRLPEGDSAGFTEQLRRPPKLHC